MNNSERLKLEAQECESDLAYMGKMKQSFRAGKVEYFEDNVLPELNKEFVVEMFAANSYRIRKTEGKDVVDFFPPSGKIFVHLTRKWINVSKEKSLTEIKKYLRVK